MIGPLGSPGWIPWPPEENAMTRRKEALPLLERTPVEAFSACPEFNFDATPIEKGIGDSITPGKGQKLLCTGAKGHDGDHTAIAENGDRLAWRREGGVPFKVKA